MTHLASSALGILLLVRERAGALINYSAPVQRVFEIANLQTFFTIL